MKGVRRLAVPIGVRVWCGMTSGAILHVPGDYPTIQSAIDAAVLTGHLKPEFGAVPIRGSGEIRVVPWA